MKILLDKNWTRALGRDIYKGVIAPPPTKESLILDIHNKLKIPQMAHKYNLSTRTIGRYLALYGLTTAIVSRKPSKEQLVQDLNKLRSLSSIGKKYNVSDNAVRKWFKSYDLAMTPPHRISKSKFEEYLNGKMTRLEIAKIHRISPRSVTLLAQKHNLSFNKLRNNQFTVNRK